MEEGSIEMNTPGTYPTCCVQLCLDGLAVNTVLQSTHINDYEGVTGGAISFDCAPQVTIGITHISLYGAPTCSLCAHILLVCACVYMYLDTCMCATVGGCWDVHVHAPMYSTCTCTHGDTCVHVCTLHCMRLVYVL